MRGYLILSGPRSGTSWIGSLANSTGVMGRSGEWLAARVLEKPMHKYTPEEHFDLVMKNASTPNGRFGVKILPIYLNGVYQNHGYDFIQKCASQYDVKLHVLKRKDRLGQAISHVRAMQTQQWQGQMRKKFWERYDYLAICEAMAMYEDIEKYWDTYLQTHKMDFDTFVYEDLCLDPTPWLNSLAEHMDVEISQRWDTYMRIQRDDKTKAWRARFLEDQEKAKIASPAPAKRGWFQRLADRLPN